jgi:hypothetical protein
MVPLLTLAVAWRKKIHRILNLDSRDPARNSIWILLECKFWAILLHHPVPFYGGLKNSCSSWLISCVRFQVFATMKISIVFRLRQSQNSGNRNLRICLI